MKKILMLLILLAPFAAAAFSDIVVSPNATKAVISWKTDDNCTGQVLYGKTASYGSSMTNITKGLTHVVKLGSLASNTQYHFKLVCKINSTFSLNSTDQTFTTLEALPDLYIKSIVVTPNSTTVGKNVTVKITVGNSGTAKASNVSLAVVCADGRTSRATILSISTGSTSSASVTCASPSAAGTYDITLVASGMTDANPRNNEGTAKVNYGEAPKPDLVLTPGDITHYLSDTSGTTYVVFRISVRNTGTAPASNVWIRVDNVWRKISSISAGSAGSLSVTVPLAGKTAFKIAVDPNETISELNEENNQVDYQIPAASTLPDIVVLASDITHTPSNPMSGNLVSISAKIRNNGSTTARNVRVIFQKVDDLYMYEKETESGKDTGEIIEKETGTLPIISQLLEGQKEKLQTTASVKGPIIGQATISSLAPRASTTVKATITIPMDTSSMLIAVTADPDNTIPESDKSNNLALHTMNIAVVYPDIYVRSNDITFYPTNPTFATPLKVKARIGNNGSITAKNVSVKFLVSTDGSPFTQAGLVVVPTIYAKGNSNAEISWVVPAGIKSASFRVDANYDKKVPEQKFSNNNATRSINISLPDLAVTTFTSTGTVSVGSQITLKATVANRGTALAENAQLVFYYLKPSGAEEIISTKSLTISPGGYPITSVQWTVPSGIGTNPVVLARINPSHSIYESDFSNNEASLALNAQLPDLQVYLSTRPQTVPIPTTSDRRNYVYISATVRNGGNARADNILVRILKGDGSLLDEQTIGTLMPGENWTITTYQAITNQFGSGDLQFSAIADPSGTITEIREDNNEAETAAHLVPNSPPNAVISSDKTEVLKREYIEFNCYNSTDPEDGGYVTCKWQFDYQYNDEGSSVMRNFDISGEHLVILTVTDTDGATDTAIGIVRVKNNQPPVVDLGDSMTVYKGEANDFTPIVAYDPDGDIVSMSWTFGDGQTASGLSATHTYANTGTYTMTVRATDDSGTTSSDSVTVYVTNAPAMTTKSGTEYYYSHHATYEYGPTANIYYGFYKVDYEVRYTTDDRIIRSVTYTVTPGTAIVTAVTDADAESFYMDMTAIAANGYTAMQLHGFDILVGGGGNLGGASGEKHISHTETDRTMSYSGLNIQMPSSGDVYVAVNSDIEYPGQMCTDTGDSCQYQVAAWRIPR